MLKSRQSVERCVRLSRFTAHYLLRTSAFSSPAVARARQPRGGCVIAFLQLRPAGSCDLVVRAVGFAGGPRNELFPAADVLADLELDFGPGRRRFEPSARARPSEA